MKQKWKMETKMKETKMKETKMKETKMMEIALKWDSIVLSGFSKEEKQLEAAFLKRIEQNISGIFE